MVEEIDNIVVEEGNDQLAIQITAGRKCSNTKNQYRLKVEHFRKWVEMKHPTFLNGDSTLNLTAIDKSLLREFFGHICKKKDKNGVYLDPTVFHAFQHVSGYKSALWDNYSNMNINITEDILKMSKQFFEGYVRMIAQLKQDGVMSIVEGKQPMSFKGYKLLAVKALEQCKDHNLAIFSHLYLLLCWNLIARCVSVGSLMYNHVSWENDSMVIVFPSHKGDQEGRNALPKHIYANTAEPHICPILSFAVYIFTRGYLREGSKRTIFAGDAESRFSKWLKNLCIENKDLLLNQGVEISMIGTHSFRKGIASFLSGTPGGPTAISIYLRAGWSLGPVQSRYILEGEGGDQVCGRAACGLPLTDVTFANLPPHFLLNDEDYLSSEEWEDILPGYSTFYPLNFREVIPFLLASLIYHQPYLAIVESSNPRHPLFLQRVWTSGVLLRLKDKVGAGCNRNPVSKMTATGVPPHLVLANSIVQLQQDMGVMRECIIAKLEQLPEALKQSMLENFQIEGTVPITRHEMQEMMRSSIDDLKRTIENSLQTIASRSIPTALIANAPIAGNENDVTFYASFKWGGDHHPVPEHFEFPV
jgi:integrase